VYNKAAAQATLFAKAALPEARFAFAAFTLPLFILINCNPYHRAPKAFDAVYPDSPIRLFTCRETVNRVKLSAALRPRKR